ncbi:MAG TPA: O-antigen ligase family protein [Pirellulaceae bacterium]
MSHKRREERRQRQPAQDGEIRWAAVLRAIVLSGGVALLVIAAMVPSEAAVSGGTYAPLAAGWCLLLVIYAASLCLDERPEIRVGWTEFTGLALVGWHSLAAMVSLGHTNGRQTLNAHWLILGYGLTALLLRQTIRTTKEAKSLVAAMIWLATLLASLGLYQYFYSAPLRRTEYERDPEKFLEAEQIPTDKDSPLRQQFENRIRSVEPLATFGLTNSLAGVLAPWLIGVLAIGYACFRSGGQWRTVIAMLLIAAILAACLLLTKSRTAYLATIAGVVLLALFGGRRSRSSWLNWQIPAGLAAATVVLGLAAVFFGGLDLQVLTEAPKSVLYRIEYWRATAKIIAQYPVFGCGPGNFQEAYTAFKLPEASETPADPHNFLLEIWATAGTPAVLLLLALLVAFAADIAAIQHLRNVKTPVDDDQPVADPKWLVLAGAMVGLLVSAPVGSALGYPLDSVSLTLRSLPQVWLLGIPLLAAIWWSLNRWLDCELDTGELPLSATIVPQLVLLINLLAAGAMVFPAVISTALVLVPVALCIAGLNARHETVARTSPRSPALPIQLKPSVLFGGLALIGALLLTVTCFYTEYYPVLNGHRALAEAMYRLEIKDYREAPGKLIAAAEADSLAPEPRRLLAELLLGRWEATESPHDWQDFSETADAYRQLDPRHHAASYTRGTWFLTAWKKSGHRQDLDVALAAFREAIQRYPNHAFYHAQLAWGLHLAGDDAAARKEAEIALNLDQKMPHQEQKLARRHVADPDPNAKPPRAFLVENAEQTAQRLRIIAVEEKP